MVDTSNKSVPEIAFMSLSLGKWEIIWGYLMGIFDVDRKIIGYMDWD